MRIASLVSLAMGFIWSSVIGQTNWVRYEGNPVLGPGGIGENGTITQGAVLYSDSLYRMWYCSSDHPDGWYLQIFYADSPDGIHWNKLGDGPVVSVGTDTAWDGTSTFGADVIYEDGLFKMWYTGRGSGYPWQIGYATSDNGIVWEKYASNPVFPAGEPGTCDSAGVLFPCVLKADSIYHMWYSNGSNSRTIQYATSVDGLVWDRYHEGTVLDVGADGEFDSWRCERPRILYFDDMFHMWYAAHDGTRQTVGYAYSPDGINWTKSIENPVFVADSSFAWEGAYVNPADVHRLTDSQLQMWYTAGTWSLRSIGYATSDTLIPPPPPPPPADHTLAIPGTAWVAGDTVHVPVILSPSTDVAGIDFTLTYDVEVLTLTGVDTTSITAGFLLASNSTAPGTLAVSLAAPYPLEIENEESVTSMDFLISSDAAIGTGSPVRFLAAALADTGGWPLDVTTSDGAVWVTWPGDINLDGIISSGDAVVTLRICIGAHDPTPEQFFMADRDSNGVVEEIDALCLLQTAVGLGCNIEGGVNGTTVVLTQPSISGSSGMDVVVPLQLSYADQLAVGSLALSLPTGLVTVTDVSGGDLLTNGFAAWHQDGNTLKVGFVAADEMTSSEGQLLNLHLRLGGDLIDQVLEVAEARLFDGRGRSMDLDVVLGSAAASGGIPQNIELRQNYPNPFNTATNIEFTLPSPQPVHLIIYDLTGCEVIRLVDGFTPMGTHTVTWNAAEVASGIYFYKMEAINYSQIFKMLLLK